MPNAVIPVSWEVAEDERLAQVARRGTYHATPDWAHAVHVEVAGLTPGRPYWYRFVVDGFASPIGRTQTAPAFDANPARLRFAIASCQHFEQGHFNAYRAMADDELDLIVHLGDYIYESSWGRNHVRKHDAPVPHTLEDYRIRHALYKSDPALQNAHRLVPWLVTWDDHEVDNDYADAISQANDLPEQFLLRRAAAYKAYYEHMPLRREATPQGPYLRLYARTPWGRLATFHKLDNRQYRTQQPCPPLGRAGGTRIEHCEARFDPRQTMLGARQEAWLEAGFAASRARWNLLAQQTLIARMDAKPGPGQVFFSDGWDGYPLARERMLKQLVARQVANPVALGGDLHFFCVADLKLDFEDERAPAIGTEFVCTSITSQSWPQAELERRLPDNPHVRLIDGSHRGYVRFEARPARLRADLRVMENVTDPAAAVRTLASFVVEDGKPGAVRA
jgi:alkaline phosphatase D